MTIAQARYIYPGTIDVYMELCRQQKKSPKYLTIEGVTSVYIGEHAEDADVIILYLHGRALNSATQSCIANYFRRWIHAAMSDRSHAIPRSPCPGHGRR